MEYSYGDATLTVSETKVEASAPATGKGFSDLVVLAAVAHERWKVDMKGLEQ